MRVMNKIAQAITMDKRKAFSKAKIVLQQYGFINLLRATYNKATGRPLLMNIDGKNYNYVITSRELDVAGNHIHKRQQTEVSLDAMIQQISSFQTTPLISVVMPLYNSPAKWLKKAIESLQAQVYDHWELCAVDDGSKDRRYMTMVHEMMASDPRIRLVCQERNGGISAASNVSLEMARGEYIALMDHDDELPADAFFWFIKEINEHPEADFIYSDECKVNTGEKSSREYSCFYLKPDWSPFLLINHMYTGHLTVYRTSIVRQVGGFRSQYDFSQDYDLALRVSDVTKNIRHIERVLYYWRTIPASAAAGAKDYARISNMAALRDWYARHDLEPVMEKKIYANYGSLLPDTNPLVSIIIPSDSYENLMTCMEGLLCNTSYKNIELIPVTNDQIANAIQPELTYLDQLHICRNNNDSGFPERCNFGAAVANGEIVIFLNDDAVPQSKDWIERLIEILRYPEVGGVSPLLLNPDGMIEYAGMFTRNPGLVGATFHKMPGSIPVPHPYNQFLMRDVSVLCGACIAISKSVFDEIGGFDAVNTPTAYSDLDLSLRLIEAGFRCVYTPHSIVTLCGNHSVGNKDEPDQAEAYCRKRWGTYLQKDPFFTNSMQEMLYKEF